MFFLPKNPALKAACLTLLATFILGFIDNFVHSISEEAGLWQFQVFRALIGITVLTAYYFIRRQPAKIHNIKSLILRSFFVSVGLLLYFSSIHLFSVSEAGAGLYTAPLWVLVFSFILFRAPISFLQCVIIVAGFIGALLVLQPDITSWDLLFIIPLTAGLLYGLGMLLTNHLCRNESTLILGIAVFITMGLISLFLLLWYSFNPANNVDFLTQGWQTPTFRFYYLALLQSLGSVFAVTFLAEAYRIAPPTFIAGFEYSFLVFASLWTYLLWGESGNFTALIGIGVIVLSGIFLSLHQKKKSER